MELVTTDLGNVSKENLFYLVNMGFLTRDGNIVGYSWTYKESVKHAWSAFCFLRDDYVKRIVSEAEKQKAGKFNVSVNDAVELMRTGFFERPYQYQGDDFVLKVEAEILETTAIARMALSKLVNSSNGSKAFSLE